MRRSCKVSQQSDHVALQEIRPNNKSVNCYTHFLIVLTLMSLLRKTSKKYHTPSRITFVGSYSQDQHSFEEIPIPASQSIMDYYDDKAIFRRFRRYQDSKFVVNAFVQQLARITSATEVIINNVCPGVVQTNLNQTAPLWFKPFMWAYTKVYRRTLHEGGRIIVKAAVVVGNESHGLFVQNSLMDQYVLAFLSMRP